MATMPPIPPFPRPLRADARRNREAILDAARAAFGAAGLEAQIDDIAADAGVGVGTVYRHFPTKEALIEALAAAHFAALSEDARAVLAEVDAGADPWDAFNGFIWSSARKLAADAGLSEIVASRPREIQQAKVTASGLSDLGEQLVERAVASGRMRADATVADIPLIMCGLGTVLGEPSRAVGMSWERYVELMLDGLRARD